MNRDQQRINEEAQRIERDALARVERVKTSFEIFEAGWDACYRRCHPPMGPGITPADSVEEAWQHLLREYER